MARDPNAEPVYAVAEAFKERCLRNGMSLLWPDIPAWSVENIGALYSALVDTPMDGGGLSFAQKLERQLEPLPIDVHRVAADTRALYYLIVAPEDIGGATKKAAVRQVIGWKIGLDPEPPAWPEVDAALDLGLASVGMYYKQNMPMGFAYILKFSSEVRNDPSILDSDLAIIALANRCMSEVKYSQAMRHALLHMLLPERFEPIVSNGHKQQIIAGFPDLKGASSDPDEQILAIRNGLAPRFPGTYYDFYSQEVEPIWRKDRDVERIRKMVESLVPDPKARQAALGVIADGIRAADEVRGSSWALGLTGSSRLRFSVLWLGAATLDKTGLTLAIDASVLPTEGADALGEFIDPDTGPHPYPSLPDATVIHIPQARLAAVAPFISEAWIAFVRETAGMVRTRCHAHDSHRPAAVRYLADELGIDLPQPDYGSEDESGYPGEFPLAELASLTHMTENDLLDLRELLDDKRQLILEGPPGSGKTFVADLLARWVAGAALDGGPDPRVEIVQFHQSYGYEDFVQGIRPVTTGSILAYEMKDGIFLAMCERARNAPDERHVLIIDEINRGNLSRIFGELLMALEYRERAVRLASGDTLAIPENLLIIGTMNSTDRSLALIDYALRRRFHFRRLAPVANGQAPVLRRWLEAQEVDGASAREVLGIFLELNRKIGERLSPDFQVGHSYFMRPDIVTAKGRERVWNHGVMPLLAEYFHGARDRETLLEEFALDRLGSTAPDTPDATSTADPADVS